MEKRKEKDYLYINMWMFLMLVGVLIVGVVGFSFPPFSFPPFIEPDTEYVLMLISSVFIWGSLLCVHLALKNVAKQSHILVWFNYFLLVFSVVMCVIAVYDSKRPIVVISLLLTIPIGFFNLLPTFYYGDEEMNI